MIEIILFMLLAVIMVVSYIFCKEGYLINAAAAGSAITDASFLTDLTGNAIRRKAPGYSGFPRIHAALGVESLQAGLPDVCARGRVTLTELNNDAIDVNFD
ncbi:unnamed protein product, partial [marine sediment metagenome]